MILQILKSRIYNPKDLYLTLCSVSQSFAGFLLSSAVTDTQKSVIFITKSFADLNLYERLVAFYKPDLPYVVLPPLDTDPYDTTSPAPEIVSRRIYAVRMIDFYQKNNMPFLLITTTSAVIQKMRHPDIITKASVFATSGKRVPIDKLSKFLTQNGYLRTSTVRESGEYAVRGGIVDIFPAGFERPVRLDFFGDVIEKMKYFDVMTQISQEVLESLDLSPISEIILSQKLIDRFRENYRTLCGTAIAPDDMMYYNISKGQYVQGMERFLPLFDNDLTHIFDIMPDADIYYDAYFNMALDEYYQDIFDSYNNQKDYKLCVAPTSMYVLNDDLMHILSGRFVRHITHHALPDADNVIDMRVKMPPHFGALRKTAGVNLFDETVKLIKNVQEHHKKQVLILCRSAGSRIKLMETLQEYELHHTDMIDCFSELSDTVTQQTVFAVCDTISGFETDTILCITEDDIFGEKTKSRGRKFKKSDKFILEAQGLTVGDYVVHAEHGIGQYLGLFAINVNNILHDCVLLEYAAGDKLYVPVENIDLLTRYGGVGANAPLDRLGSASWQARKAKLKQRITDIADGLIKTAAMRALQTGEVITPMGDIYEDFCARFPYNETDDQLSAIEAVVDDLSSGRPMDRLVCGDVGFGKTEVAMRAAFLAAAAGLQTAIIVPTTLLARQHYRNFIERFEGQPFKIGRLSRMVPQKERDETKQGLSDGTVHIVIGTHALLSKSTEFKNLGLMIIDEEQHFGVSHKEKLKSIRANIHVLTLTATPIPRTLQLSMTGVRDLSLIATPPVDRLAIKTYITPFDKLMIRDALLREKYRGGQAFFVVPRLSDIHEVSEFLNDVVPEISFIVGHGQMPPAQLDDVMNGFFDRKYDVLLATTIIESGIDIPTANTMIVWRSDMFGLAQLYQIRGRIGRAKLRSYAYLTVPPKKILTDTAISRLKVLESLDSLGAGFTLASHDMDIRGAGNLLGDEQSGHIKEVGFELYQQMLEEALATLRSGNETVDIGAGNKSPNINIGLSAIIPETYIADLPTRLGLYRRLADIESKQDINSFAAELIDRFGNLPPEVENLLSIIHIKNACKKACISKIDAGDKGILIAFYKDTFPNLDKLLAWTGQMRGRAKIRPDNRLSVSVQMDTPQDKFKKTLKIIREIADLLRSE